LITYKDSGVDIEKGERLVERIKKMVGKLPSEGIVSSIGGFSALFSLKKYGSDLILSSATDGVGTKLAVAQMADKHDTVGIDLVAMNVNDIITNGSSPAFFLDYISYAEVKDRVLEDIIYGITDGLYQSNAALIGGETAQMPGMYKKGEYDLAGFCVGIARKEELIKNEIKEGDAVIGISSSGFHSNGFSLLRHLFFDVAGYDLDTLLEGVPLAEVLLKPTNIYVKVFEAIKPFVKAAVHITGGGFYENIPRVLSGRFDVVIEKKKMPSAAIFEVVKDIGKLSEKEMYGTFNMGVGFIVVVNKEDLSSVVQAIEKDGYEAYRLGYVKNGTGRVEIV